MLWQCFYQPSPQSLHQSLREPKEIVRRKLAPERSRIPVMKRKHLKTQGQRPREGAQGKSRARTEAHEQRGAASGCSWDIGRARWTEFVPYKQRKSTFRGRNNTGYAQSTWGLKTVPQILPETSQRQLPSRVWHEEQAFPSSLQEDIWWMFVLKGPVQWIGSEKSLVVSICWKRGRETHLDRQRVCPRSGGRQGGSRHRMWWIPG